MPDNPHGGTDHGLKTHGTDNPHGLKTTQSWRQSSRLRGAKRFSRGPKFENNHKSHCFQKSNFVDGGGPSMSIGRARLPLAPAFKQVTNALEQR